MYFKPVRLIWSIACFSTLISVSRADDVFQTAPETEVQVQRPDLINEAPSPDGFEQTPGTSQSSDINQMQLDATTGDLLAEPDSLSLAAAVSASGGSSDDLIKKFRSQPLWNDVTNNGSFSYRYPIAMPAFRGLEPKIELDYNSSRKTKTGGTYQGWLGYGWGLSGVSIIERAGHLQGVPRYRNDDTYLLNGDLIVPCANNTQGASCTAGGNWVSEVETYLKIRYSSSTNIWEITARDGTKTTLEAVGAIAGEDSAVEGDTDNHVRLRYRWLVTSVRDTSGNAVIYDYDCSDLPVCYPTKISYFNSGEAGTALTDFQPTPTTSHGSATFYYENRPDYIVAANGHTLSTTKKRIKSIVTRIGASTIAEYKLGYDQAPLNNASRLTSVQQFGADRSTALPANTFSYNDAYTGSDGTKAGFGNGVSASNINVIPYLHIQRSFEEDLNGHPVYTDDWLPQLSVLDVNSDGISEIIQGCSTLFHRSSSTSAFLSTSLSGVTCASHLVKDLGNDNSNKFYVPGFTLGHLGTDKEQTQFASLGYVDDTATVKRITNFSKQGETFSISTTDCDTVTDPLIRDNVCGKQPPDLTAIDTVGYGQDVLTEIKNTRGHFFGDSRDVTTTSAENDFRCAGCVAVDLNGDGLDDLVKTDPITNYTGTPAGGRIFRTYLLTGDHFVEWSDEFNVEQDVSFTLGLDRDGDGKGEILFGRGKVIKEVEDHDNNNEPLEYTVENAGFWLISVQSTIGRPLVEEPLNSRGAYVAAGDFNGDGMSDLLLTPALDAGPLPLSIIDRATASGRKRFS